MSHTRNLAKRWAIFGFLLLTFPSFAAGTNLWRIQGADAFEKGKPSNVAVSSLGELSLAPAIETVAQTGEPYIWALVRDDAGNIYAGTGNGGKVYRIDGEGNATVLVNTPEVAILSLAIGPDGALYAGTSPDGLIYRIDLSEEKPTPETIFHEGDAYIWALQFDDAGTLYAATGDNGKLYRLTPDAQNPGSFTAEVLFDSDEPHLLSMALHDGLVYVGSDGSGYLYRIDPTQPGKGFVLYDTSEKEVRNILVDGDGNLIISTATGQLPRPQPPGVAIPQSDQPPMQSYLYRVTPNGVADRFWKSNDGTVLSIAWYGDAVLTGTGDEGKVRLVALDGKTTSLGNVSEAQVLTILPVDDGFLLATGNSGKIFALGATVADEGSWESEPFDAQIVSQWGAVRWEGKTPEGTTTEIATRSGNTETPDATWSDWSDPTTDSDGSKVTSPTARFLQLRIRLGTTNPAQSPLVRLVELAYLQENLAPEVQSITVEIAREDNNRPPRRSTGKTTRRTAKWDVQDPNSDPLEYALYYRAEGETQWHLLKDELTETNYTWDTASMPDGEYRLKVVASDRRGNPADRARTTEFIGEPFRLDNTPPIIADLAASRNGDSAVRLTFTANDATSYIAGAAYSIDADKWQVLFPTDALLDSRSERFEVVIPNVPEGTHSVAVRVKDVAGNQATARGRF